MYDSEREGWRMCTFVNVEDDKCVGLWTKRLTKGRMCSFVNVKTIECVAVCERKNCRMCKFVDVEID